MTYLNLADYWNYCPDTGVVTWKRKNARNTVIGSTIGSDNGNGYLVGRFNGKNILIHRAAFLLMGEELPETVDHKNGDRKDNRWVNLRPATQRQQCMNCTRRSHGTTGIKGVFPNNSKRNPFLSRIVVNGEKLHIGCFPTAEAARDAYQAAARKHFGDFYTER